MIAVREFTNGADVLAHAAQIRRKFYGSRQMVPTQGMAAAEITANVTPETPSGEAGSDMSQPVAVSTNDLLANFRQIHLNRRYGRINEDAPTFLTKTAIRDAVLSEFNLSKVEISMERRHQKIVIPRQAAMYLMCKHTTSSTSSIGRFLGGFDHTTVMHGRERTERRMAEDAAFAARIAAIEARLTLQGAVE